MFCSYLTLEFYVLMLDGLYLIFTVFDGKLMLSLYSSGDLLMIFPRFVCKLRPNMWEHCVTAVLSKCFCFRLLPYKNQLVHSFLIDVIVIFSRVLGPIHELPCIRERDQLILLSTVLSVTKDFYKISSFLLYSSTLQTSFARVQGYHSGLALFITITPPNNFIIIISKF